MTLREWQQWMQDGITGDAGHPALAIYRHAYRTRVVETLHTMFPALHHALDTLFDEFALAFLRERPPHGHTLDALAPAFAEYLGDTRAFPDESWPDFMIELAQLEAAFHELHDAPLAVRPFRFRYPVHVYLLAVRAGNPPAEFPDPRPTCVAVTRRHWRVVLREVAREELEQLQQGDAKQRIDWSLRPSRPHGNC
jgi:hypothetical protein